MRICYYADGRYVHAERWMRYFINKGHEMHLISFAEVSEERAAELAKMGIKYHGSTGNVHIKKPWLTLRDLKFVRRTLNEERIDILHSHFLGPNVWYGALSGFRPHVITVMGGDVIGQDWKPDRSIQERYLTPYALRKAAVVTAWSKSLADRVSKYTEPGKAVQVIHGGVDLDRLRLTEETGSLRREYDIPLDAKIVFSSRLIRELYNIDMIAAAADRVCRIAPERIFLMALPETILEASYIERVRSIFAAGSARDNVRYIPTIEHGRMADHFRLADVTVSIPDTDGTPMTVLESMACGTPTVIGNLPDYDKGYFEDGKTTVMVDVKDPQSIADGIVKILTDDALRAEITAEARRRVEETGSYEYQMSKMEAIYRKLV